MNLAAVQALSKSMLIVALGSVNSWYSVAYLLADMTLYLGIKVLRNDFTYHMPIYGVVGFILHFMVRVVAKLITDFTATIHFRHPRELGGLYFSINSFSPLIGMVLLLTLTKEGAFKETTRKHLQDATMFLGVSLFTLAGLFFLLINKEYR
ncbi:hypothetical protein TL16_g00030 [Triparma laevis f. inornata]|uniref:Uncharacterized protein n=1 Tax=Triparma laevis f. inornata TaxID=1714386 RepID=A0A9W6Z9Z7_9STRA|nr:hypothetical protein TL16_g00030 [Triparma laevis f. inornata]